MAPIIIWSDVDNIPNEQYERNVSQNETVSFNLEKGCTCIIIWPTNAYFKIDIVFIIYSIIVCFTIPTVLITILYVLIIKSLRKNERFRRTSISIDKISEPRRKVTKRVLLLISVIVICYTPYWINQIVLLVYYTLEAFQTKLFYYVSSRLSTIFQILICFNSALNPYLYGLFNKNFNTTNQMFLIKCGFCKIISISSSITNFKRNEDNISIYQKNKRLSFRNSVL